MGQVASATGRMTVFSGESILMVSAINRTPHMTTTFSESPAATVLSL